MGHASSSGSEDASQLSTPLLAPSQPILAHKLSSRRGRRKARNRGLRSRPTAAAGWTSTSLYGLIHASENAHQRDESFLTFEVSTCHSPERKTITTRAIFFPWNMETPAEFNSESRECNKSATPLTECIAQPRGTNFFSQHYRGTHFFPEIKI